MITEYPHFSLPAIHECSFHLHGRLTASPYLDLDVLKGKADHTRVLDELFLKQEGSGAIRWDRCSALPVQEK
jgi:flavin reductase (DIM6/NTAB) family NADH-FMN oxidoreductase RutF